MMQFRRALKRAWGKSIFLIAAVCRTWFTGLIFIAAGAGYLFYGMLWVARLMQSSKEKFFRIATALLVVAGFYAALLPLGPAGPRVEVRIAPGTPLRAIARQLQGCRVIPWSGGLVAWIKCTGREKRIHAGRFIFSEHEGVVSAARKLLYSKPIEVVVTVPEGLTIGQTADIFQAALDIDPSAFDSLSRNAPFLKKLNMSDSSLEGYLFPETYRFPESVAAADVLKKMAEQFNQAYKTLDSLPCGQTVMSKRQIVILASIIEKEAALAGERARISAVFHNRLHKGMPLGADPTVRYIYKKFSGPLLESELKNPSPYNTRVNTGLPPGPICSPGLAALQAAICPAKSGELYFVAKWDGSGGHWFSMTNEEHIRKKMEARRVNVRRIMRESRASD